MIGDLARGKEISRVILIEDSAEHQGRTVLACFVINLLQRLDEVHMITFDVKSSHLIDVIPVDLKSKFLIHTCHRDILGWNGSTTHHVNSDLVKMIQEKCQGQDKKVAVVIDSISPLLLYRSAPYTCQTLHNLGNREQKGFSIEQLVCLMHQDLHDDTSKSLVEHTASTVVKVMESRSKDHKACCSTLHKKISGKIIRITEHFNITADFDVKDVTELRQSSLPVISSSDEQADPTANLTFNLSLTDKEKQDRSQVNLPYTYNTQKQEDASGGEGKIFYQPDEADDFDEEDPDDDLDI